MSFAKVLGLLVFTCLSVTAHAQSAGGGKRIEIQPILLNPPSFGGRPVLDLSKGQGPINFNKPGGGVTVGGGELRTLEAVCKAFVQTRLNADVKSADNSREVAAVSFRSLTNIVSTLKRLETRLYLTSIERDLLHRLKSDVTHWDETFSGLALSNCVDEKWEKIPRIDHAQEAYLLESLEFIRATLITNNQ